MSNSFQIANKEISSSSSPYVIAEVGINHNGCIDTALEMVEIAKLSGADAVKFQTFKATEFCGGREQLFRYFSQGQEVTESMLDMFQRFELADDDWAKIRARSIEIGIDFFSSPQNASDLDLLLSVGVPAIKIGSDDLSNLPLIKYYASKKLPLILSSGMADLAEVHQALEAAGWLQGNLVAMLVCTSQYPTPALDVNIKRVKTLQDAFPSLLVGFSDHTQGNDAAIMAVSLGAKIFEKHFTLSHDLAGPDHWFSLSPTELKSWVESIHQAHLMLGTGIVSPTLDEMKMRRIARRSILALRNIEPGEIIDDQSIGLRRPGNGLSPALFESILGTKALRPIKNGDFIELGDFR